MRKSPQILITGGTGLLGKTLFETAPADWNVTATHHKSLPPSEWRNRFLPMELCDPVSVDEVFRRTRPEIVIHTASVGSVDEAELHPERVRQVNVEGARRVGEACQRARSFLITISSNAVFDGNLPPYSEGSPTRAMSRYGRFKIEIEEWAKQSGLDHLIVRPILIYGWPLPGGRGNAVTRWLEDMERGKPVRVAADITSMPLLAADCAKAIWKAAQQKLQGILHLAGPDRISLAEFARLTARTFGCAESLVLPVPSSQLGLAAERPKDTSFVTRRMQSELGLRTLNAAEGLAFMLRCRTAVY